MLQWLADCTSDDTFSEDVLIVWFVKSLLIKVLKSKNRGRLELLLDVVKCIEIFRSQIKITIVYSIAIKS